MNYFYLMTALIPMRQVIFTALVLTRGNSHREGKSSAKFTQQVGSGAGIQTEADWFPKLSTYPPDTPQCTHMNIALSRSERSLARVMSSKKY